MEKKLDCKAQEDSSPCSCCGHVPDTHRKQQIRHLHCKSEGMVKFISELQKILGAKGGFKKMIAAVKILRENVYPETWRCTSDLGTVTHSENGRIQWELKRESEGFRLFLFYLVSGGTEIHYACVNDDGMLCAPDGNVLDLAWWDAPYYMDIPAAPPGPKGEQQTNYCVI